MYKYFIIFCLIEIELDKTRTWCPRAGCETVCLIGATSTQSDGDALASTSAAAAATSTSTANVGATLSPSLAGVGISGSGASGGVATTTVGNIIPTPMQCAVLCPSCKDEFCSACKKTVCTSKKAYYVCMCEYILVIMV